MATFLDRWHVLLGVSCIGLGLVVLLGCDKRSRTDGRMPDATVIAVVCAALSMVVLASSRPAWLVVIAGLLPAFHRARVPRRNEPTVRLALGIAWSSLIGIWATVPDTEPALVAGCVVAPVVVAALVRRSPVAPQAVAALTALAVIASADGSASRWPAALGAICCLVLPAASMALVWSGWCGSVGLRGAIAVEHLAAMTVGSRVVAHDPVGRAAGVTIAVIGVVVVTQATVTMLGGGGPYEGGESRD